ncbi:hypothetical protein PVAND_014829 [Polypedilum vanderplanki]|uniref:Peptidase S1 domain-containing protein n=1 Tax=Polypedilum vanderplanki TaxID=319348 RepID=A0A9J6BBB6_POLVA|nr:hypothetical protein PVAND_014829 [Polypedilum vanderplanki]
MFLKVLFISILVSNSHQYLEPSNFKIVTIDLQIPSDEEIENFPQEDRENRILNGNNANSGQFPFAAYIHVTRDTGTVYCTGSLIASNWIITARSCFINVNNIPGTSFQAFCGSIDNQSPALISSFANHGAWIDDINNRDHPNIAVFRLFNDMPTTNLIRPIRLPRLANEHFGFDDFNITTVGWGRMSNGAFPRILQFGNFRILASHLCFWNPAFSPNNFCSQHQTLNSMVSIERGEGGASIITENDGIQTLIGITSTIFGLPNGIGAANLRVSSFLRFINDRTGIPFR